MTMEANKRSKGQRSSYRISIIEIECFKTSCGELREVEIMRFEFSAIFWLMLNTSASSFGTSSSQRSVRPAFSTTTTTSDALSFVQRGGATEYPTALSASVDTASATSVSSANLELLSDKGRKAVLNLIEHDVDGAQKHVYENWPEPGQEDEGKQKLADQVSIA